MRLNIRLQLTLGLLPGLLFLLFIAGLGYFNTRTFDRAHHQLVGALDEMRVTKNLQIAILRALGPLNDTLVRGPTLGGAALFEALAAEVDQRSAAAGSDFDQPEKLALLAQAQADWKTVKTVGFSITNPPRGDVDAVERIKQMDTAAEVVNADLERLHSILVGEVNSIIAATEATHQAADRLLFLGTGLAIAGGALFALRFPRSLARPILELREGAVRFGRGELDLRLPQGRRDELGDLAAAFNVMAAQLSEAQSGLERKVAGRTRELAAVHDVAAAANESLELQVTLEHALDKLLEVMRVEAGEIFLLDEDRQAVVMAAHRGLFSESFREITRFNLGEGFPGRVAQTGWPLVTTDLGKDLRFLRREVIDAGVGSFACVPLRAQGEVVGTIDVAALGQRLFAPEEVDLLVNIGNQLGLAIANAWLYEGERSQRQIAETLRRVSQTLNASLNLDDVLHRLLEQLGEVLVVDAGLILLREGDCLRVVAVRGRPELRMERLLRYALPLAANAAFFRALQEKRALTFCEPGRQPPFADGIHPIEEVDWCLVVPLLRDEEVIGLLALEQIGHCYDLEEEPQIAFAFANHAAVAIENARLYSQVKTFNRELEERVQARTAELAEARDALARQADELRRVLNKTMRIQEAERHRLAQEIHDGVTQWVMGAQFEIQAAKVCLPVKPQEALARLEAAQHVLRQAKVEMRRVIYDLHPPALASGGLSHALEEYVANYREFSSIACRLQVTGEPCRLPADHELAVYRIVQEALNNVKLHTSAASVQVRLDFAPASLTVTVADDGHGFEAEQANGQQHDGLGLIGMRERAQSIGGDLRIESQPDAGVTVRLAVPLRGKSSEG